MDELFLFNRLRLEVSGQVPRANRLRCGRTHSRPRRHYLLNCWAFQTFRTAVLIYAVTAGVTAPSA